MGPREAVGPVGDVSGDNSGRASALARVPEIAVGGLRFAIEAGDRHGAQGFLDALERVIKPWTGRSRRRVCWTERRLATAHVALGQRSHFTARFTRVTAVVPVPALKEVPNVLGSSPKTTLAAWSLDSAKAFPFGCALPRIQGRSLARWCTRFLPRATGATAFGSQP